MEIFVFLLCMALVGADTSESSRRRKIKKKIAVVDETEVAELPPPEMILDHQPEPEQVKSGRGFLDEYYSKFDSRTEKVEENSNEHQSSQGHVHARSKSDVYKPHGSINQLEKEAGGSINQLEMGSTIGARSKDESVSRNWVDLALPSENLIEPSPGLLKVGDLLKPQPSTLESKHSFKASHLVAGNPGLYSNTHLQNQAERRTDTDTQLEKLKAQEQQLLDMLSRESELSETEKVQLLEQLELWEQHRNKLLQIKKIEEQVNRDRDVKSTSLPNPFKGFLAQVLPTSLTGPAGPDTIEELEEDDTVIRSSYGAPGFGYGATGSGYGDPATTDNRVSKYFGLAGTTSKDIQLGLTFTVPFLSIPLKSINNILGGNFGDIGSLLNFGNIDTTSIITFAVIAIGAIFILPQAIFWLTGINLSTFNWGRSDADVGSSVVTLANTVDTALQEFNIDSRGCLAKSICGSLYDGKKTSFLGETLAKSAVSNEAMKTFLGPEHMSLLEEAGAQGEQGFRCDAHFRASCPWDPTGVTNIVMKIMESQGTSLAEVALKAVAAAASN